MWPNPQKIADLVTFTEEIFNGKLHFLWSAIFLPSKCSNLMLRSKPVQRKCLHIFKELKKTVRVNIFKYKNAAWVTHRFSYALHHNNGNNMILPSTATCLIHIFLTKSIFFYRRSFHSFADDSQSKQN